ncbi:Cysteine proteinase inhibitor 4 [Platanthera guangdongensis]|uniref:Cysteine proteinase inhibitor 4 n=1 Tax=Platanthera guangdongensis TaxID=2320717 RepID=A0ABR2M1B1_9ASPA
MAVKVHSVLILSVVVVAALLFFNSKAAAARQLNGVEQIKDVKHNKEVQELGRFTLEEANKKVSESSEKMTFGEVVSSKRWPVTGGVRYFFAISSVKGGKTEGSFFGYLVVRNYSNERIPMSWVFQPTFP